MYTIDPYQQYMYSYPHKTAYGPLEGVSLADHLGALAGGEGKNSLYFHVPFCEGKCGYCNLFSIPGMPEREMERYVDAMERQAEQIAGKLWEQVVERTREEAVERMREEQEKPGEQATEIRFDDLTLGGGTPLLLPERQLRRIFRIAGDYFSWGAGGYPAVPVIVETSPRQAAEEKLALLKEEGVSRVSIGVQSFNEKELRTLHRIQSAAEAEKALQRIKRLNFACLNIDIIYGIPGQTEESLITSIKTALSYEPEEMFVYPLYVKPGTALYRERQKPSADRIRLFRTARHLLVEAGYIPYSMRRFVRGVSQPEAASCGFDNTLAIGCGGRSYLGNLHTCTPYRVMPSQCLEELREYRRRQDYLTVDFGFILNEDEQKRRYLIRHILFGPGIDRREYRRRFGGDALAEFPLFARWEEEGFARIERERIFLTEEGFELSDALGPELISPAVRERMRRWDFMNPRGSGA